MGVSFQYLDPFELTFQQGIIRFKQIKLFSQAFDFRPVIMNVVIFKLILFLDYSLLYFQQLEPSRLQPDIVLAKILILHKLTDSKFQIRHFLALHD
jgi:hypothetical protein